MIEVVYVSSNVTAGAGTLVYAIAIKDKMKFGCNNPNISVSCSNGNPFISGGNVVIPMKVKVTATSVNGNGVVTRIKEFSYDFAASYVNATLPATVVATANTFNTSVVDGCCCKSNVLTEGTVSIVVTAER